MKKVKISALAAAVMATVLLVSSPAISEEKKAEQTQQTTFYTSIWQKLRVFVSKRASRDTTTVSAVAGIRGAANHGDAGLQPVWKDGSGKRQSQKVSPEVAMLKQAEELAGQRRFVKSLEVYQDFLKKYPGSELRPSVEFAIGLTYAEMSDKMKAVDQLKDFVKKYPEHDLTDDARSVIEQLQD